MSDSCSVMPDSLEPQGLQPARLLCPWNSPGKITGVGCISFSRGSSQHRDPALLDSLYHLSHQESLLLRDISKYKDMSTLKVSADTCLTLSYNIQTTEMKKKIISRQKIKCKQKVMLENCAYLHLIVNFTLERFSVGKFKCVCTLFGGEVAKQEI